MKEFNVIIEKDSDGLFIASVPEVHGFHTQGKTVDSAVKRIHEAIELCLEEYGDKAQTRDFVVFKELRFKYEQAQPQAQWQSINQTSKEARL